jgi:c-di-GMP-related signal transduction protein
MKKRLISNIETFKNCVVLISSEQLADYLSIVETRNLIDNLTKAMHQAIDYEFGERN